MKKDKTNYLGNQTYVSKVVKGPEVAVTTPSVLEIFGSIQPNTNKKISGDVPYNRGSMLNHLTNLEMHKKAQVNNKDATELFAAAYMEIEGITYNPGGISLEIVEVNSKKAYKANTALIHANLSAIQAKQNLALKQLTEMNWFTNAKSAIKSNIEATTIALLSVPYNTAAILNAFLSLGNLVAMITEMVTMDRDNTSFWQNLQSVMSRRSMVSKIALFSSTCDNLYMSKTAAAYISSLKKVCKGSKGLNTPYTTVKVELDNMIDALRINVSGSDTIEFENCPSFGIDLTSETNAFDFQKVVALVELLSGANDDATEKANGIKFTLNNNEYKVTTAKGLTDFFEKVLDSMQQKVNTLIANNADFYAALQVIASTGILNNDFAKLMHIQSYYIESMKVNYTTSHLNILATATSYINMNITKDSQNNIEINVPTVASFKPFRDFETNGILLYIDIGSPDYVPLLDWLKARVTKVMPWVKTEEIASEGRTRWYFIKMQHDKNGVPYLPVVAQSGVRSNTVQNRIQYRMMLRLGLWFANYGFRIGGTDDAPNIFYMSSPAITNFMTFSYKSIANQVVDSAPLAIGLNKVSPIDAFGQ